MTSKYDLLKKPSVNVKNVYILNILINMCCNYGTKTPIPHSLTPVVEEGVKNIRGFVGLNRHENIVCKLYI